MNKHLSCPSCKRAYEYELDICTWCHVPLFVTETTDERVVAVTRVDVPSIGHEEVPYWCALAENDAGRLSLHKLSQETSVGEPLHDDAAQERTGTVGIIGTGTMGVGLTGLMASLDWDVVFVSRTMESAQQARDVVLERLSRTMDERELAAAGDHILPTDDPAALADCDVVIESVAEDLTVKRETLQRIEPHLRPDALLVTNTSGLSLDELASVLQHPVRFGALHFFNPVNRMRLVETSAASATSSETAEELDRLAIALGKTPVRVKARPAFVVNRVLMPLINEAVRSLEEEAADAEHIDEAIRLGLNHPMGPLALADLIGLDVVVEIMENLVEQTGDDGYRPRPSLTRLVAAGQLGRKAGSGFYTYE